MENEDIANSEKNKLKALARKNFANVLQSQAESRQPIMEIKSNEKTCQLVRIENSKITKVQPISAASPPTTCNTVTTYNTTCDIIENIEATTSMSNAVRDRTLKSLAINYNLALKAKDGDSQVFIYEPMYINSTTLKPTNPEKFYKSEDSITNEKMPVKPSDYLLNENTAVYKCYLCPYYHVKEMMIARHMIQNHLSQNIYRCPYCPAQFLTNYLAFHHIKRIHGSDVEMKINLKQSDQHHSSLSLVYKKDLFLEGDETIVLDESDKKSTNKSGASVSIKCHKCSLYCKSLSELQDHLKFIHFRYRPYSCSLCNYSKVCFASKLDLDHHMKTTHPNELWVRSSTSPQPATTSLAKRDEYYVNINWSQVWSICPETGDFLCQWCSFRTEVSRMMFQHATKEHNWSKSISCPTCKINHLLKACHFFICKIVCSCNTVLYIEHEKHLPKQPNIENSYMCKLCTHQSFSRPNIIRHLKYNHTQCKPFSCLYCTYAAKEVSKIKNHVLALHPNKPFKMVDKEQCNEDFKKLLEDLFEKNILVQKFSNLETLHTDDSEYTINVSKNVLGDSFFECGTCYYSSKNIEEVYSHAKSVHGQTMKPTVRERRNVVIPYGEHYRCIMCGYRCSDRSCMSRHAKYMHITSRPHACPYCHYNNVEKTKVRLHVLSHHPNLPKLVKTNQRLLEQMSWEAKKFYVRVDANGDEHSDVNGNESYSAKVKQGKLVSADQHYLPSDEETGDADTIHKYQQNPSHPNKCPPSILPAPSTMLQAPLTPPPIIVKMEPMETEVDIKIEELEYEDVRMSDEEHQSPDTIIRNISLNNAYIGEVDNLNVDGLEDVSGDVDTKSSNYEDMGNIGNPGDDDDDKLCDEVLENFSDGDDDDFDDEMISDIDDLSVGLSNEDDDDDDDDASSSNEVDELKISAPRKKVSMVDMSSFVIEKKILKDAKLSIMVPIVKLVDLNHDFDP